MQELKDIFIEGTAKSPQVDFKNLTGELKLSGRSYPENSFQVYEPLFLWINEYIKSPNQITNLYLKLEYFNTSSLLCIAQIIKTLCRIEQKDYSLFIHLYFDNEDFDIREMDNLKDVISLQIHNIGELKIKIGIRVHGTDTDGNIVEDSTILL